MLSAADNELLTHVGPGTPMGDLLRQYWMPILQSSDLAEPGGKPFRMKLLDEPLIAFRDTRGRVGLLTEVGPHRGASLYWGRNEEGGIRCVYHGWKYDVTGACVDMPNEPASSNFKSKVRIASYPTQERNGMVWAYMGARKDPPPLPSLEWNMLPEDHVIVWKHLQLSNWVQGLEGNVDSSHLSFLHARLKREGDAGFPNTRDRGLFHNDKAPAMEVVDTEYGVMYGAGRREQPGLTYWRVTQFLMPFYGMFAPVSANECPLQWWVPLDDHHVMKWEVRWNPERPLTPGERVGLWSEDPGGIVEPTGDPLTHHRPVAGPDNDYFAEWDKQLTHRVSALPSVNVADKAILETMGPIVDRTIEHLGTSDAMIIRTRKRLLEAAKALRDHGTVPPGVDTPDVYGIRSATVVLKDGDGSWIDASRKGVRAFDGPVMSQEAQMTGGYRFDTRS